MRIGIAAAMGLVVASAAFAGPMSPATQHLFEAIQQDDLEAVQASIAKGADVKARNELGMLPIDLAVERGYFDIAHYLLSLRQMERAPATGEPSAAPATEDDVPLAPAAGSAGPTPDSGGPFDPRAVPETAHHPLITGPGPVAPGGDLAEPPRQPDTTGDQHSRATAPAADQQPFRQAKAPPRSRVSQDPVPSGLTSGLRIVDGHPAVTKPARPGSTLSAALATEVGVAPGTVPPASAAPLPDGILTLGKTVHLASRRPPRRAGGQANYCVDKDRSSVTFCVEPVDWPPDLAAQLRVSTIMYQGTRTVVRYDEGLATRYHAIFPAAAFETLVAYFTQRFGPPAEALERRIAPFAQPRRDNPVRLWRRDDPRSGKQTMLEVRQYDDARGGFPDLRHGAVMLYNADSEPIFPVLSALDLMPTAGAN